MTSLRAWAVLLVFGVIPCAPVVRGNSSAIPSPLEYSLQESLDRLGYTVNVPESIEGRPLIVWQPYRVSSRSDALSTEWFKSRGAVHFKVLGRQTAQPTSLSFGVLPAGRKSLILLKQLHSDESFWLSRRIGRSATYRGAQPFTVYWQGSQRKLTFPALRGGRWVRQRNGKGYWKGGRSEGGYLFCWDDSADGDFNDLIVLAEKIRLVRAR